MQYKPVLVAQGVGGRVSPAAIQTPPAWDSSCSSLRHVSGCISCYFTSTPPCISHLREVCSELPGFGRKDLTPEAE